MRQPANLRSTVLTSTALVLVAGLTSAVATCASAQVFVRAPAGPLAALLFMPPLQGAPEPVENPPNPNAPPSETVGQNSVGATSTTAPTAPQAPPGALPPPPPGDGPRFYSLHRPYGLTPDPMPAVPPR